MMSTHAFVDGGHFRRVAEEFGIAQPDPQQLLVNRLAPHDTIRPILPKITRITYYDARPDDDSESEFEEYWKKIELLPDTHLGWGLLRGKRRRRREGRGQKGVDSLIAVDMLVGAFNRLFSVAILVFGDADFIPVVHEVQRQGVNVIVVAGSRYSDDLRRAADRFFLLDASTRGWFTSLAEA